MAAYVTLCWLVAIVVRAQAPTLLNLQIGTSIGSTLSLGQSYNITVLATGGAPLSYQWFKDGAAISGATSVTYSINSFSSGDVGAYTVTVSNGSGSVTSGTNNLYLSVPPPVITQQPQSVTVLAGGTAVFSVTATGTNLQYIWHLGATRSSPQIGTGSTLTLNNVALSDTGTYTVEVYSSGNSGNSILSNQAHLAVGAPPVLSTPLVGAVKEGDTFPLIQAGATGGVPLAISVLKNGVSVGGNVSNVAPSVSYIYYPPSSQVTWLASDSGVYTVVASNQWGSVTSAPVTVVITAAPKITSQPLRQTLAAGSSPSLSVTATGTAPLAYQWSKNGAAIAGATSSTLSFNNTTAADGGVYTVTVSNATGSVTSDQTLLEIFPPPSILAQPQSVVANPSDRPVFSVFVRSGISAFSNSPQLSYQWYHNGVAVTDGPSVFGSISDTLRITNAQSADAGVYKVVITDGYSTVTSDSATLVLNGPALAPTIIVQPQSLSSVFGVHITGFTVVASGTAPMTYDWTFTSSNGPGNVYHPDLLNPDLTFAGLFDATEVGTYRVTVSNAFGSVTSTPATLSGPVAPVISSQPSSVTVTAGNSTTFSVVATGTGPFTYQWFKDSQALAGAAASSLSIANAQTPNAGNYWVVVTGPGGTVQSNSVTLGLNPNNTGPSSPTISAQPSSVTVDTGATATFAVTASGAGTLTYQWFKDGQALSGATSSTLSVTNTQTVNVGSYWVVVTGSGGGTQSNAVTLGLNTGNSSGTSSTGNLPVSPTITLQPVSQSTFSGDTVSFAVVASGTPAPTYQWYFNGAQIGGATFSTCVLAAVQASNAGSYRVVVSNSAGSVTSSTVALNVSSSTYGGVYFGKLGSDGSAGNFALYLRSDNTGDMLITAPAAKSALILNNFTLNFDGTFTIIGSKYSLSIPAREPAVELRAEMAAAADQVTVTGAISSSGAISGTASGLGLTLGGGKSAGGSSLAGFYQAAALNGGVGSIYVIVGPDGKAVVVTQAGVTTDIGTGSLDAQGKLNLTTNAGVSLGLAFDATTGAISATADKGPLAGEAFDGIRDNVDQTDRLANISTRGRVGSGDEIMIAGFVVSGSSPRSVLVRAIGPSLATLGVAGALNDSHLALFRGNTKIAESDDWGAEASASAIISATSQVGAFSLSTGSKDAVLLTTLSPGSYTAQVSGPDNGTGIGLVEVYDAGVGPVSSSTPKLINISTRARVGINDEILIAGIVVTGNAPKRLLVRAVGPTLASLGVNGVLADPVLSIFSGSTVISQNDDWGGNTDIASAAVAVGAFALPTGSTDACLLITLAPGVYTAQVTGKGGATGIALVEVYEVPF